MGHTFSFSETTVSSAWLARSPAASALTELTVAWKRMRSGEDPGGRGLRRMRLSSRQCAESPGRRPRRKIQIVICPPVEVHGTVDSPENRTAGSTAPGTPGPDIVFRLSTAGHRDDDRLGPRLGAA